MRALVDDAQRDPPPPEVREENEKETQNRPTDAAVAPSFLDGGGGRVSSGRSTGLTICDAASFFFFAKNETSEATTARPRVLFVAAQRVQRVVDINSERSMYYTRPGHSDA